MHRSAEQSGDVAHRKIVDVAQRQSCPLHRVEISQHLAGTSRFEVDDQTAAVGSVACVREQVTLLAFLAPPMVHQLVAGDADQVADVDRGDGLPALMWSTAASDRLGGEIFGEGTPAASTQHIRIQLGDRPIDVVDECIGFHSIES